MSIFGDVGKTMAGVGAVGSSQGWGVPLAIAGSAMSLLDAIFGSGDEAAQRRKMQRAQDAQAMMGQMGQQTQQAMQQESQNRFNTGMQQQPRYDPFRDPEFLSRLAARVQGR